MTTWLRAAGVRAIRTFAQTAVAALTVNGAAAGLEDVSWVAVGSTAALAAVISLLTSVGGLPEVTSTGRHAAEPGGPIEY